MEHLELLPKETCVPVSSYFLYHPTAPLLESACMGLLTPDTAYKPNQTMYGPLSIPELMTAELLPLWSVNGAATIIHTQGLRSHTSHFSSMSKPRSRMSGLYANLLKKRQTVSPNSHTILFPHLHCRWGWLRFLHTLSTQAIVSFYLLVIKQHFFLNLFCFSLPYIVLFIPITTLRKEPMLIFHKPSVNWRNDRLGDRGVSRLGTLRKTSSQAAWVQGLSSSENTTEASRFRSFQLWRSQTINLYCLKLSSLSQFSLWLHR